MFPITTDNYVNRPTLEHSILMASKVLLPDKVGEYTVIVGPDGSGKTSTVANVFNNMKGVVNVCVSQVDTTKSLFSTLARCVIRKEVVFRDTKLDAQFDLEILFPILITVAKQQRDNLPITVVFEVDGGSPQTEIDWVQLAAKQLAHSCNVIVVMSAADAAATFRGDGRQQFIWVDEMTHEEATTYARKLHPTVAEDDLTLLFDKVGTLPLNVGKGVLALKRGVPADEIVLQAVTSAEADIDAFTHQTIIGALKWKNDLDGVSVREFWRFRNDKEVMNYVEPRAVAVAMKMRNAVVYDPLSCEYRLASRAHRTALLKRYESGK